MKSATSVIALALIVIFGASVAHAAKLYRWVDEKGEVHYTDTVPPEQTQKEHRELNDQGITVKQVEKAITPEQKAAAQRAKDEAARKEQEEKARLEAERQNAQRLLDTYASEQDIIAARERNIATLDGTINFSKTNLEKLRATQKSLEADLATTNQKDAQTKIQSNLDLTKKQIADMEVFIQNKLTERDTLAQNYDKDLARYRELVQASAPKPAQ